MKKLLGLVLLVGVVAVAAHYLKEGGLPFMQALAEDEQVLNRLEGELNALQREIAQAGRGAAVSGLDTTAQVAGAADRLERIEREYRQLKPKLSSEAALAAARRLEDRIEELTATLR